MKLDEMEVGSPEWEAEVARLDIAEGTELETAQATAEAEAKAKDEAGAEAKKLDEEKPAAAEVQTDPEKPAVPSGIMSKDGTTVLPYVALTNSRAQAKAERTARLEAEERATALEQQLADLRAGKKPEEAELTEAEMADLEEYAPKAAAAIKQAKATSERLAELERKSAPARAAEPEDDPVQEAIDGLPMLAGWQASEPEKFARAVALDDALKGSPKWSGSTPAALAKRFAHVTGMVADEFDIQIPDTPPTDKGQSKAEPAKIIPQAVERIAPNTLSDFKGGGPEADLRIDKMGGVDQYNRLAAMSKAEFDAYCAKL